VHSFARVSFFLSSFAFCVYILHTFFVCAFVASSKGATIPSSSVVSAIVDIPIPPPLSLEPSTPSTCRTLRPATPHPNSVSKPSTIIGNQSQSVGRSVSNIGASFNAANEADSSLAIPAGIQPVQPPAAILHRADGSTFSTNDNYSKSVEPTASLGTDALHTANEAQSVDVTTQDQSYTAAPDLCAEDSCQRATVSALSQPVSVSKSSVPDVNLSTVSTKMLAAVADMSYDSDASSECEFAGNSTFSVTSPSGMALELATNENEALAGSLANDRTAFSSTANQSEAVVNCRPSLANKDPTCKSALLPASQGQVPAKCTTVSANHSEATSLTPSLSRLSTIPFTLSEFPFSSGINFFSSFFANSVFLIKSFSRFFCLFLENQLRRQN